jgi:hypothetical protein
MTEESVSVQLQPEAKQPKFEQKGQGKRIIPESVARFLDSPPLLVGEDPAEYRHLLEEVALAISPKNVIEWLGVKDVCDFSWEMFRLQRLKGAVVTLGRKPALEKILHKVINRKRPDYAEQVHRLSADWFTNLTVKEEVRKIFEPMNLSEESINAQAFSDSCDKISVLDNFLGNAALRRNNALKEIERNRASLIAPQKQTDVIDSDPDFTAKSSVTELKRSPAALLDPR